ncbi:MAG: hypothetical protein JWM07_714 [Candidatus Saccharibacteria bacterium]|nr:hypothetical protein [Candidatus Saccharibacteria bacterium]
MLDIRSTVDLPVPTAKEQSVVSARLKAISLRIEGDQHAVCGVHSLIQWQQNIIPTFKNTRADCQKIVASVVDFQKQLAKIIAYDNDDQALAGILSTVPQMSEVAEDAMEARMTAWDNTAKNIEKMKVSDAFKLTQQTASKHSMAIKIAWADIIAAHQAKDKQKYLAAQNSLAAAIDDFNEVSNTSQQSVAVLAGDLEKAFRSASTD